MVIVPKIPTAINEILIFITIQDINRRGLNFGVVEEARITIVDGDGKELLSYSLSKEFARFNSVQFGSLMRTETGWDFIAVGAGINGDLNTILDNYWK